MADETIGVRGSERCQSTPTVRPFYMGEAGMSTMVKTFGVGLAGLLTAGLAAAQVPVSHDEGGLQQVQATSPIVYQSPAQPEQLSNPPAPTADAPIPAVTQPPQNQLPPGTVTSPWNGPGGTGCCGPVGGNGPIMSELFLRSGVNLPVAGGIFNNATQAGYVQQFGMRTLYFDPIGSKAWTLEGAIVYNYNNGSRSEYEFDIFGTFAQIREFHRAGVHLAFGREYYLFTPGYQCGKNYRAGLDVGGRYGYARANLNVVSEDGQTIEFDRRSDVYGGVFVAFHTDVEIPLGQCFTFVTGVRTEWGYNFTDIIPTWDSDLQDVNVMLNFGWKY